MSRYCTSCGKEINSDSSFCTSCGAAVNPSYTGESSGSTQYSQPSYSPAPNTAYQSNTSQNIDPNLVSTGTFLGLEFLFMLPFIGWIICIVMACTGTNQNIKNYAKAKIIWMIISIAISVLIIVSLIMSGGLLLDLIKYISGNVSKL